MKALSKQKLTVPVTDVLRIHSIACSGWQIRLSNYLARTDNKQNVTFTQAEVNEMFDVASMAQRLVLEKVFGPRREPIDFNKLKMGSKVMCKYTGQHCWHDEGIDYKKPFDIVIFNSEYTISRDGAAESTPHGLKFKKLNSKRTILHQDGLFMMYGSVHDYITDVIEY